MVKSGAQSFYIGSDPVVRVSLRLAQSATKTRREDGVRGDKGGQDLGSQRDSPNSAAVQQRALPGHQRSL